MTDALQLLRNRNSAPKLTEPAPDGEQLNTLFKAALRAPDHAGLRPWRFLVTAGEDREALGEVFAHALRRRNPEATNAECEKARSKAMRAPMIVTVIVRIQEHPKVPPVEQRLSGGCAAYGLLLGAEAMGYNGIWRTGANAYDPEVMRELGLADDEEIVGYLYLGTREGRAKPLPEHPVAEFVQRWPRSGDR